MANRFIVCVLFLAACVSAMAQTTVRTLRPEDVLRIQVFGQAGIGGDAPVDPNGNITAPFAGTIHVEGRTIAEVEAELTRIYKQRLFLRDPIVSVTIVSLRALRAIVGGGGIARPGPYPIRPGDTILNLLSQAGGANRDVADLKRAYLRRAGTYESVPIDLYALTVFGDVSQNYEVQDGDELVVPESRGNQVLVLGTIQRPGLFPFREPMTAWDAIGLAGGEITRRSRFSRTVILRQREGLTGVYVRIPVDLVRFIRKGDSSQNILLKPGDILYVPETNTPDFTYIGSLASVGFLLDSVGRNLFGLNIFGRR